MVSQVMPQGAAATGAQAATQSRLSSKFEIACKIALITALSLSALAISAAAIAGGVALAAAATSGWVVFGGVILIGTGIGIACAALASPAISCGDGKNAQDYRGREPPFSFTTTTSLVNDCATYARNHLLVTLAGAVIGGGVVAIAPIAFAVVLIA